MPYGVTLVWGPLSDRVGRRSMILGSLVAFIVLTAATALVDTAGGFIVMRVATAVGGSGVVPIALALVGDLFAFQRRGRALGWLIGGMAGGIAVGSTAGALAGPVIGWPGLFLAVAVGGLLLLLAVLVVGAIPAVPRPVASPPLRRSGSSGVCRSTWAPP